jgi:hypothetical protein
MASPRNHEFGEVVFIVCQGNGFLGEIDKVWKLNEILMKEPAEVHQNVLIIILKL